MILTHTISLPELLWTVWCTAGLIFLLKLLWDSVEDWRWVIQTNTNGLREYAAVNSVLIFGTMTLTQLTFVIGGVIALMLPTKDHVITPLTYVFTGLFIFASSVKTIMAIIILARKENLVKRIESGEWVISSKKD